MTPSIGLLRTRLTRPLEEMKNMLIGQSYDLYWTHHVAAPTAREYLQMVDGSKTSLHLKFRLKS